LLAEACPGVLGEQDRDAFCERLAELKAAGVPADLAGRVAVMPLLPSVFDVIEVADATERPPEAVTATYFALGARVALTWLRDRILELPRANRWQALARAALRDDLYSLQRELTQEVLEVASPDADAEAAIDAWRGQHEAAVERAMGIIDDIRGSRTYDTTTLPVALREIRNVVNRARVGD
jgi:glutamate dehydrogenase